MWDEDRDTSEEDDHVLAFFDTLIGQEEMLDGSPDSSSSSSSLPPLSSDGDDVDEDEGRSSSDRFPFWFSSHDDRTPSDWSSPANTSSLEPPWSDSDQSLLESDGSGEETGEDSEEEGPSDNNNDDGVVGGPDSTVEGPVGDETAGLAWRPLRNVTRKGPLERATGGTVLRNASEESATGGTESRALDSEIVQPRVLATIGKSC